MQKRTFFAKMEATPLNELTAISDLERNRLQEIEYTKVSLLLLNKKRNELEQLRNLLVLAVERCVTNTQN